MKTDNRLSKRQEIEALKVRVDALEKALMRASENFELIQKMCNAEKVTQERLPTPTRDPKTAIWWSR